ncbi:MAG: Asp-tRNA(Asn)/Glu-tRNA(Gln) amidotransferase subunit GatA [Bacteroidetes bacterium]|nr:MAG: Asp-tRNA(Asn)/Glu-tRNA(Gln) amidotransferase subunit GatA [Bacteroidota bacterium]
MTPDSLHTTAYHAHRQALDAGRLCCEELVQGFLERIRATEELNIYLEVFESEALQRARRLDAKPPEERGKLFGLVVSLKDVICYAEHRVEGGSRILQGFRSLYSATAVERLLAEDAILIGRVNCDEFAMGSSTENPWFGPTRNAADRERVAGGSSGGSAVAVQAGTCHVSLGSDTGGSVRQPAAFCGVVGLKPTYGRVSRHGLLAYASSFDQIGVLSPTVEDAARVLEVIAGPDDFDATAAQSPVPPFSQARWEGSARIAYFPEMLEHRGLDPEIRAATFQALERLGAAGHAVEPVEFPWLEYLVPTYYVLTTAEAGSNLSRYDGVRYGYRSADAADFRQVFEKTRTEAFGREVKRRIMLGTFVLSAGYYDAYYTQALKVRRLIKEQLEALFQDFDFLAAPVSPVFPWRIGALKDDPVAMYLADIYTVLANLAGLPALTLPLPRPPAALPIGVQFMAPPFEEARLLGFCASEANF